MFYKLMNMDDDLEINLQKSDLFSGGLTILRLAGYKINELNRKKDLLSTILKEFGIRFGEKLLEILNMMMKFDPKDRCSSFSEIDYLLKVKKI